MGKTRYQYLDVSHRLSRSSDTCCWTLLNKRGNSDTKERIALIQRFISIFGKDRIVNVFADREFIGEKWFTWLIENDIHFCIRVKKTLL